jgi:hypothetical protein
MSAQELVCRKSFSAGALQLKDFERTRPATGNQAASDLARRKPSVHDVRAPYLDRLPVQLRARSRQRPERPYRALELDRRPRPVEYALVLPDLARVRHAVLGLGQRACTASREVGERGNDHFGAEIGKPRVQAARVVIFAYRECALGEYRTGVEPRVHLHDRNPGLAVACEERALDRRCAAPARPERGVDVDGAITAGIEEGRRQ